LFRPYDLVVVRAEDADPKEHFVMSADAVVRMAAGQATDCTPLAVWALESRQFDTLRSLDFFGNFIRRKCFRSWHQASKQQRHTYVMHAGLHARALLHTMAGVDGSEVH